MSQPSEVATTVVETVAERENVDPDDLPPLSADLDEATLDRLTGTEGPLTEPFRFEYLWYDVTVLPDEEVVVTP